jgi:hypothetical protein
MKDERKEQAGSIAQEEATQQGHSIKHEQAFALRAAVLHSKDLCTPTGFSMFALSHRRGSASLLKAVACKC